MRDRCLIAAAVAMSFASAAWADEYRVVHNRAPLGDAGNAQFSISQSEFDEGVTYLQQRDYGYAYDRFAKLAASGNPRAMRMISLMYARGLGRRADDSQAIAWLESAAKLGDAPAMLLLGKIYSRGLGVKADRERGAYWLEQAKGHGEPEIRGQAGDALRALQR